MNEEAKRDMQFVTNDLLYDNRILSTFIENAEVGLYVSDFYTCEILFANRKVGAFIGHDVKEIIGKPCWSFFNPQENRRCPFCPHDKLVDDNGKPVGSYVWEIFNERYGMWLKVISEAITWVDGRLAQMMTFYDITETKNMQDSLSKLAFTDQLLGLPNGIKLENDWESFESYPSLIIFDVISLQKVNEAYGREIGDALLISLREWIYALHIPDSTLYRVGGDEFCLSISRISPESLNSIAKSLAERFTEPWLFDHFGNRMTIFCGVSVGVINGSFIQKEERLLNLIERTLEAAKENGKIIVYDDELDKKFKKLLQFELSLKRCVRENMDGFDVHYQPIADPITGTWYGLEALCRWKSPELGVVSPNMFIPEAERLELIGAIGLWALETAVRKCKGWGLDKNRKFILDVNLSAIQFTDESLAEKIIKVLQTYDFPGEKLCLEITESTQFTFTDLSLQTIQILRSKNILVALDDFGTGYSNFNNLKSLPIDIVKIERVFVTNIERDSYQQYLFHAMAELAHASDMKLIAEGVETREQLDILLKNGADYLQGYLFSKPLPPDELEKQLNRFYEIDQSFSVIRNRKIDVKELLDAESSYILTPNLYKILNRGMRILFYHADIDEAINQVLKIVGLHMDVSRSYIFLREKGDVYNNTHWWSADNITLPKEPIKRIDAPESWLNLLSSDGIVMANDIAHLPEDVREIISGQSIKAIVAIPLWDGSELFGFVGCDDCRYMRDWRPEEIILLHNLCVIITSMLSKKKLEKEIRLRAEIQSDIMNHLDLPVYVSDIETDEILFANDHMKKQFGNIEGKVCWKAIHGFEKKCDFCKVDALLNNPDIEQYTWNIYNESLGKHYRVRESLIPWINNSRAHLAYAVDIEKPENG